MLPVNSISDKTRLKAMQLNLPVESVDERTYSVPSATTPGRFHTIQFNRASSPRSFTCSCEAFERGRGCHHVARVLAVHFVRRQQLSIGAGRVSTFARAQVSTSHHLSAALDCLVSIADFTRQDELDVADVCRVARLADYARGEILAVLDAGVSTERRAA